MDEEMKKSNEEMLRLMGWTRVHGRDFGKYEKAWANDHGQVVLIDERTRILKLSERDAASNDVKAKMIDNRRTS